MQPTSVAPNPLRAPGRMKYHSMTGCPRCAVCLEGYSAPGHRYGGRRVCSQCWQGLMQLERRGAFRSFPRTSLLALFTAEVAVRQPGPLEAYAERVAS